MSPTYWGPNGPMSQGQYQQWQRQLRRDVAAKKNALFKDTPPRRGRDGKIRPGFTKSQSDKMANSPKANNDYMLKFLSSDFTKADVDWNDEGWEFVGYH